MVMEELVSSLAKLTEEAIVTRAESDWQDHVGWGAIDGFASRCLFDVNYT